ncbi:phage tail tape measure protein [Mogibacterium timidum]|uniref:phage tail tape measure protein n=1 Tax=Mogibacterium timidum TaxID=35519 RepID=UPI0028DD3069|nr:phage tail tape measure protein [Mogibacterium timidum]
MAGNIKGITIEFRGETTKLGNALKKIKGEAGKTKSELSKIDKALKFKPGNAELLIQKQHALKEKVAQTTEKLKALKAAQAKMDANGVDKCSAEYKELRREIITTEAQQKLFNKELKKLAYPKLTALGTQMKEIGNKAKAVGGAMTQYLTVPLAAVGGASLKVTADFDSAMSKVKAVSGATGREFEQLRDKAKEMGEKTKFSAAESAEAMNYMAMAGWKTSDMLKGISGIMNLAAASGADLATTSDIVTDALTAFGLSASESSHFADVLAATSSNANTNVTLMGESFKTAAPAAAALGYSAEDTSLAIGLMANAGIKGSEAGTALRAGLLRLASPTAEAKAAMEKYGITLTDANGKMLPFKNVMEQLRQKMSGLSETEKTAALTAIFGKNAFSGWAAVVNGSDKDFNKLSSAIANCDGVAQKMADEMNDNLGGQLIILKSQLQGIAISIGDTLVPIMRKLVSIVQSVAEWFNNLSSTQKKVVVYVGLIVGALGPVIAILGAIAAAIGAIIAFAAPLAAFIGIFVAIGAAIGALFVIFKNLPAAWKELKESAKAWWDGMKADLSAFAGFFIDIWNSVSSKVMGVWNSLKSGALTVWSGIKDVISGVVGGIKFVIGGAVNGIISIWNGLKSLGATAAKIFGNVKSAALHPVETLKNKIRSIIDAIKRFFHFSVPRPHIPLPHFSISPSGWRVGDLLKGSIPHLGLKWYKNGGIFDSASVIGVGEAGTEAVVPLDKLWGQLDSLFKENNSQQAVMLTQIVQLMKELIIVSQQPTRIKMNDREFGRLINSVT